MEGIGKNLTVGAVMILLPCFYFGILGLFLQENAFAVLTGLLVGMSILLRAVGSLAFEHQRPLAVRMRLLAAVAIALAGASLIGAILHVLGVFLPIA